MTPGTGRWLPVGLVALGAGVVRTDLMMGAGWAANLAAAEWLIRRPAARRTRSNRTRAAVAGA